MSRKKESINNAEPVIELTIEERMEILVKLLLDTIEDEIKEHADAATSKS